MFLWTEESAAFWNDSAAYTHSYDCLADKAASRLVPGSTLFEGGCGLGYLSMALAKRGFHVTAMDISPLPLRFLRERASREGIRLVVREEDAFSMLANEVYDSAVFCFFGSTEKLLRWAADHCRNRVILFKKNWNTHRFAKDPGIIRKFTYPLTVEELNRAGVPFETEVFDVDMGQPFRNVGDAVRFFRLYDPAGAMSEAEVRSRLSETGDLLFPLFLSSIRSVGMIVLSADDVRKRNRL